MYMVSGLYWDGMYIRNPRIAKRPPERLLEKNMMIAQNRIHNITLEGTLSHNLFQLPKEDCK